MLVLKLFLKNTYYGYYNEGFDQVTAYFKIAREKCFLKYEKRGSLTSRFDPIEVEECIEQNALKCFKIIIFSAQKWQGNDQFAK